MGDDLSDLTDYERGVVDALTQMAWSHGDQTVLEMKGDNTKFDNWRELIDLAIEQREQEFDEAVDDESR